jgi:hypothetical protein
MIRPLTAVAVAVALAAALGTLAGCAAHGGGAVQPNARGEIPVAVQLHVHGHSHHNSPERPGSTSWHSDYAKSSGYDVLWWSDHTRLLDQQNAFVLPLGNASLDDSSLGIRMSAGPRGRVGYLAPLVTGGSPTARLRRNALEVALTAPEDSAWSRFTYSPRESETRRRRVRGFLLARPIWSEPVIDVRAALEGSGADAHAIILVPLAWHRIGGASIHQSLLFRLHAGEGEPVVHVDPPRTVEVDLFLPEGKGPLAIPLLEYARLLPEGDDNTVTDLSIGVEARHGATIAATFSGVRLRSVAPGPGGIWSHLEELAARNGRAFGLAEYLGGESNRTALHMNAFLPDSADVFPTLWPMPPPEGFADSLVARVHAVGGLVSFNHMFGVGIGPVVKAEAELSRRAAAVAESLLAVRLYGADLIEVGYLQRGGADLEHHLWVWDYLTAHGLFVPGTGVTDAHGNEYGPSMRNPFITWAWSRSVSRRDLVDALRAGRAAFGDPYAFGGALDFTVDGTPMGGTLECAADTATLRAEVRGAPERSEVRLMQGLIDSAPDHESVDYVARGTLVDASRPIVLDTRRPSFVRLEIWRGTQPLAFSNPVILLKPAAR